MKALVEGTKAAGFIPTIVPDPTVLASTTSTAPLGLSAILGTREDVLHEVQTIQAHIRLWYAKEPDQVMREASAYSARLLELQSMLQIAETKDRTYVGVRTRHVQPTVDEIDRQFRLHSRMVELRRQDLALLGGMT